MSAKAEPRLVNPANWAYRQHFFGREVSIKKYDYMMQKWIKQTQLDLIDQIARATNHIAVSSALLTRRQREKYKDKRTVTGRNTWYLYPADAVPLDVYDAVNPKDGQYVYY